MQEQSKDLDTTAVCSNEGETMKNRNYITINIELEKNGTFTTRTRSSMNGIKPDQAMLMLIRAQSMISEITSQIITVEVNEVK